MTTNASRRAIAAGVVVTLLGALIELGCAARNASGQEPKSKPAARVLITGRIVDPAGRPVAGATVRVAQVVKAKGDDLTLWIEAIRKGRFWAADNYLIRPSSDIPKAHQPTATTDAQGRFRFEDFGAEQLLGLLVEGPTIATMTLNVITRRTDAMYTHGHWIHGADFSAIALPVRPVEGVVRDAKTHQPLAGVEIRTDWFLHSWWVAWEDLKTTTDAQGRFRLVGLSRNWREGLLAVPNRDQPYIAQRFAVANTSPFDLRLIPALKDVQDIPKAGKSLIILADVKGQLHARVFDDAGKMVADADETRLSKTSRKFAIRSLREQLQEQWPPHVLTRGEKDEGILSAAWIAGYDLPDPPGHVPVWLEIDLHRGIWIEGKVTEKETGQPVAGLYPYYVPLVENRFARGIPAFSDLNHSGDFYDNTAGAPSDRSKTQPNGTYRLVGLPGRGIVGVNIYREPYLQEGYGGLDAQGRFQVESSERPVFMRRPGKRFVAPVKEIIPPAGAESFHVDFEVVPGQKVRLRVVDARPAGRRAAGRRASSSRWGIRGRARPGGVRRVGAGTQRGSRGVDPPQRVGSWARPCMSAPGMTRTSPWSSRLSPWPPSPGA